MLFYPPRSDALFSNYFEDLFCYHLGLPAGSFLLQPMNDRELRRFINEHLQPTEQFNRKCNEKTDELAEFLKTSTKFSVSEVFKVQYLTLLPYRPSKIILFVMLL